jgi:hypothetical protein
MARVTMLALAALAALTLAGCPAAHDAYPDTRSTSCQTDDDCFKGEICSASKCVVGMHDMAMHDAANGGDQ